MWESSSSSGLQTKINEQFVAAEREAEILAQFQHKNIIHILGVVYWDEVNFGMIMEYVPCGDLENPLHYEKDVDLPWKLRARFFTELANALDYIHNHGSKRSYIHGDLKPQNVLLENMLEIKLADFGSVAIAQVTSATSLAINDKGNTQHTPHYAASEFLKNPTEKKTKSMDVYSFAMIGYEILTRNVVFSGAPSDLVIKLIIETGQKPDVECLLKVEKSLEQNKDDKEIFNKLEDEVKMCWQTEVVHRPLISDVKKRLEELPPAKKYNPTTIDDAAKTVIEQRKLKKKLPLRERPGKMATTKKVRKTFLEYASKQALVFLLVLGITAAVILFPTFSNSELPLSNNNKGYFLILHPSRLSMSDMTSGVITFITNQPKNKTSFNQMVKVNDLIYMFPRDASRPLVSLNLTDSALTYKEIDWEERYRRRNYIALGCYLFAVGGMHKNSSYASKAVQKSGTFFASSAVDRYDTVTKKWTAMENMLEPRENPTLVLFQGSLCALEANAKECFNLNNKKWTYLPPIASSPHPLYRAAVEITNELYVFGSAPADTKTVVKYNPAKNSWTRVASLNKPKIYATAGVYQNKIYIIGANEHLVEKYDPARNVWEFANSVILTGFEACTAF